jgi:hypothetical protein
MDPVFFALAVTAFLNPCVTKSKSHLAQGIGQSLSALRGKLYDY